MKQGIFKKISTFLLGSILALGVGVAVSAPHKDAMRVDAADTLAYTINLTGSEAEGTTLGKGNLSNITGDGVSTYINSLTTCASTFGPTSDGIKLGAKSSAGTFTFSLKAAGQLKPSKIVVNAKLYNSSKPATLDVNSIGAQSVSSSFRDLEFTYSGNSNITSISLNSSKYIWVKSVSVYTAPIVTFDSITLSGTYPTTFTQGDTFSHSGMTVTANYTNQDDVDVTSSATFSGYNMSTTGDQTVTVSYTDTTLSVTKTATYNITVNEPKTVSSFTLLGGVSSGDTIKEVVESTDTSITGTAVYYLLKFSDNSYGAASLSWNTEDGISNVVHFTNEDAGDDNGGYVKPTFTKNGTYTLTLSYASETSLVISWKVKGFPTIVYVDDTLTASNIDNPSSYSAWSGKTKSITGINSEASYSGYSTGGSTYIQMRAQDSGIYTTASGGKISKVTVSWNSSTLSDRHVLVYGSNSAFSNITDMDNSAVDKATGDIDNNNSETEYTFTSDYAFVGIRIFGGAAYFDSIKFTWAVEEAPTDTLKSIAITSEPTTTTYYAGQSISANGYVVTATFEDDEEKTYESDVTAETVWTISYPTALAIDEGTTKDVTFTASYTAGSVTKTDSKDKTITIAADSVTALGWSNRGTINAFSGTTLGDAVDTTKWTFTPTWASGKADSPSWGTGSDDVHVGLYATATPTAESETKLTSSYVLQASDNGKYLVAYYKGTRTNSNVAINVTKWRSVIESSDLSGTITWSSATATVTGDVSATVTNVQYYVYENSSLRLGTGSGGGKITIATQANIVSVQVTAKAYNDGYEGILTIGDKSVDVQSTDYTKYNLVTLTTPTKSLSISTASKNVRLNIQSIVINCSGSQEIGKTDDCVGLEKFIDKYLRSDLAFDPDPDLPVNQTTECESLYPSAKDAFNGEKGDYKLNEHQRELFATNSAYKNEYDRLMAWATHVGDSLNETTYSLERINQLNSFNMSENSSTSVILIISVISLATLGGTVLIRKRKEQE